MTVADTTITRLPGGLRVVTRSLPGARATSLGAWVGVGSRDETPATAGSSHFLEHLLFKGTRTRGAREVAIAVDSVGGDLNAFTTRELTAFYARVPGHWADDGAELLLDVVTNPAVRADDVESERAVILDELRLALDEPGDRVQTLLYEHLFADHALGWDVSGSFDTVTALRRGDLAAFHAQHYLAANVVVAAAGVVDHDRLVELAAEAFAERSDDQRPRRDAPVGLAAAGAHEARDLEEVQIGYGWRGVGLDDPDRHAVSVLAQLLGGGPSSRLFHEIREKRGLAYSIYAAPTNFTDVGAFEIQTATAPDRHRQVDKLIRAEIDDLVDGGVTDREVDVAKGYLAGSVALGFEDSWSHLSHVANSMLVRDRVVEIDEYLDAIAVVTTEDVTRLARCLLAAEPTVATVGPLA